MEEGYCVKWEKHHNAVCSVFDNLYKHNICVDCTLAAENKYIKAHRIVLMACSPYFEDLLSQHSDNYPIVWMNMKFTELQALIDFCYRGEVKLPQEELPGFLNAARLLHIKGLCDSSDSYRKRRLTSVGGSVRKKRAVSPSGLVSKVSVSDVLCEEADEPDTEDGEISHHQIVQTNGDSYHLPGEDSDRSDLDTDEESDAGEGEENDSIMLDDLIKGSGVTQFLYRWTCSKCGEAFPTRATYMEHKKGCTADPSVDHPWRCHKCPNTYKNKKDLVRHLIYCGTETERHVCDRCGNTYKYERGLKRHKIYCGTNVQPMVCDACGKTYKYKRGLRRHQKTQCGLINSYLEKQAAKAVEAEKLTSNQFHQSETITQSESSPNKVTTKMEMSTPIKVEEEIIIDTPHSQIKELPAICKKCGKSYKYKKAFLNHITSCDPNAITLEDEIEEGLETQITKVEVHATQDDDDQETIENIMEEIQATEIELHSEEQEKQIISEESQMNNIDDTQTLKMDLETTVEPLNT